MPFRQRKRFTKRKFTKRRAPIVKLIKRVIQSQAEHKYRDDSAQQTSLVASPFETFLNNIAQGAGRGARIGNDIKPSMLHLRFSIELLIAGEINNVRVYLYQNLEAAKPLQLPTIGTLWPPYEVALSRYKILYDKTFEMSLGVNQNIFRNIRIPGSKMRTIEFEGTGSSLAGTLHIVFVTNNVTIDAVSVEYESRLYYTDV